MGYDDPITTSKPVIKLDSPLQDGKIKLLTDKLKELQKNPPDELNIVTSRHIFKKVQIKSIGADYIEVAGYHETIKYSFDAGYGIHIIPIKKIQGVCSN